jgi:hypothetical protein
MAEKAQQLPIAAVRRIVVMIVVLVVDRKLTKPLAIEFAPAPSTDPGEKLERSLPVGFLQFCPRILHRHIYTSGFTVWNDTPMEWSNDYTIQFETDYSVIRLCRNHQFSSQGLFATIASMHR